MDFTPPSDMSLIQELHRESSVESARNITLEKCNPYRRTPMSSTISVGRTHQIYFIRSSPESPDCPHEMCAESVNCGSLSAKHKETFLILHSPLRSTGNMRNIAQIPDASCAWILYGKHAIREQLVNMAENVIPGSLVVLFVR